LENQWLRPIFCGVERLFLITSFPGTIDMPIYEYRCDACGHELEKLQRMSESPLTECPACGKPTLRRLISAAGFRLKGSGWYETDFKKDNKRNVVESAKDTGEKSSKRDDTSKTADSKPAEGGKKDSKPASESGKKSSESKASAA
jgi:putative FmdB family regulatory protein